MMAQTMMEQRTNVIDHSLFTACVHDPSGFGSLVLLLTVGFFPNVNLLHLFASVFVVSEVVGVANVASVEIVDDSNTSKIRFEADDLDVTNLVDTEVYASRSELLRNKARMRQQATLCGIRILIL